MRVLPHRPSCPSRQLSTLIDGRVVDGGKTVDTPRPEPGPGHIRRAARPRWFAAAACVTHAVPRAAAHALAIEADAVGRLRRPCVATFSATLRCTCRASTRGRREERGGGSAPTRVLACLHWKHIQRTHRSAGFSVLGPSHTPPPLGWPAVATALPNRVPSTGFGSESPPRCLISRRL